MSEREWLEGLRPEDRDPVPARRPVDPVLDALDRLDASLDTLDYYCSHPTGTVASECRVCIVVAEGKEALATVREALELREKDARTAMGAAERFREQGMKDAERAVAAEAENQRLQAELDAELIGHGRDARDAALVDTVRRLTAELKLATEGLRETKAALDRERGGGSPLTHKEYLALHERVRALLSANPPQGDAADFCEHGYTTEDSAHPSAGLERCPTCSPSDGGGAK